MADPLAQAARRGPSAGRAAVSVSLAAPASRFSFRGSPEAARQAAAGFGCALPTEACRSVSSANRAALWLGPDEWLLLGRDATPTAEIAASIETTVGTVPHALIDISHGQVGIEVWGEPAALLLNAGCPLDLALAAFPVGMSTRTVLAKADITLWRQAEDRFWIEVGRSFAPYVMGFLDQARSDGL